jgi:hypothetical protein
MWAYSAFCLLFYFHSDLVLEEERQEDMTLRWQSGACSNYDYLLYLNSMADRSFSDLTQYPVMPWIVQDYTSDVLGDLEHFVPYSQICLNSFAASHLHRLNKFLQHKSKI